MSTRSHHRGCSHVVTISYDHGHLRSSVSTCYHPPLLPTLRSPGDFVRDYFIIQKEKQQHRSEAPHEVHGPTRKTMADGPYLPITLRSRAAVRNTPITASPPMCFKPPTQSHHRGHSRVIPLGIARVCTRRGGWTNRRTAATSPSWRSKSRTIGVWISDCLCPSWESDCRPQAIPAVRRSGRVKGGSWCAMEFVAKVEPLDKTKTCVVVQDYPSMRKCKNHTIRNKSTTKFPLHFWTLVLVICDRIRDASRRRHVAQSACMICNFRSQPPECVDRKQIKVNVYVFFRQV